MFKTHFNWKTNSTRHLKISMKRGCYSGNCKGTYCKKNHKKHGELKKGRIKIRMPESRVAKISTDFEFNIIDASTRTKYIKIINEFHFDSFV